MAQCAPNGGCTAWTPASPAYAVAPQGGYPQGGYGPQGGEVPDRYGAGPSEGAAPGYGPANRYGEGYGYVAGPVGGGYGRGGQAYPGYGRRAYGLAGVCDVCARPLPAPAYAAPVVIAPAPEIETDVGQGFFYGDSAGGVVSGESLGGGGGGGGVFGSRRIRDRLRLRERLRLVLRHRAGLCERIGFGSGQRLGDGDRHVQFEQQLQFGRKRLAQRWLGRPLRRLRL